MPPKPWSEMRGCERIMEGARKNLYLVAPLLIVTALCTALALFTEHVLPPGLPQTAFKITFFALAAYGAYSLWAASAPATAHARAAAAEVAKVADARTAASAEEVARELLAAEEAEKAAQKGAGKGKFVKRA